MINQTGKDRAHIIDESSYVLKRIALVDVEIDIGRLAIWAEKQANEVVGKEVQNLKVCVVLSAAEPSGFRAAPRVFSLFDRSFPPEINETFM